MSDTDNKKAEAYDATEEATKDEKPLAVQITKESDVSSFLEGELYDVDESNKSYLAKSKILADAINEIGFGRYQYGLFFVAGFGWLSDNALSLIHI